MNLTTLIFELQRGLLLLIDRTGPDISNHQDVRNHITMLKVPSRQANGVSASSSTKAVILVSSPTNLTHFTPCSPDARTRWEDPHEEQDSDHCLSMYPKSVTPPDLYHSSSLTIASPYSMSLVTPSSGTACRPLPKSLQSKKSSSLATTMKQSSATSSRTRHESSPKSKCNTSVNTKL